MSYSVAVQVPQYSLGTLQDLENISLTAAGTSAAPPVPPGGGARGGPPIQILGNVASITRGATLGTVTHYNIAPVLDIFGNVVNTDLASVAAKIDRVLSDAKRELPRGSQLAVRGQVQTMRSSFVGLTGGLVFSILLVYLLIVVNFQSWLDPLIIISSSAAGGARRAWFGSSSSRTRTSACPRSPGRSCAWGSRPRTRSSS